MTHKFPPGGDVVPIRNILGLSRSKNYLVLAVSNCGTAFEYAFIMIKNDNGQVYWTSAGDFEPAEIRLTDSGAMEYDDIIASLGEYA